MDTLSIDDILNSHNTVVDNINSALENTPPRISTNSDQIIIALLARQLCGADSISALSSRQFYTYIPTILRSMLEALADLVNIINDPEHIRVMTYSYSKQEVIFLEHITTNSYLKPKDSELDDSLARLEKARAYCKDNDCLKKNGNRIRNFWTPGLQKNTRRRTICFVGQRIITLTS